MQIRRAGIVFVLLAMSLVTPTFASAQFGDSLPCPGAHFATQQEADAASPKGSIVAGVTYVCPGDAALGINNQAGAAKDFLKTILCAPDKDNYGGYGPDETIRRLDPKFAQCAATFLKALNSSGSGQYCIREGARTVEKQNQYVASGVIACKNGAACEHPRGIAIDINNRAGGGCTAYTAAHNLAPQFGLTFYLGCKDAYHFVPQKGGCTDANFVPSISGTSGVNTGGTNAAGYLPKNFYDYPQYAPASASSPFSTAIGALAPLLSNSFSQPSQPTSYPTSYPTNTTTGFETTPLPTATSSIFEVPPPYTYPLTTSSVKNTPTGPSAFDQIELIAGGSHTTGSSQGTQTGTSAPTQLNGDLYDIGTTPTGGSNVKVDEGVMNTIAENSVKVDPIHVTETFSHDEPTLVAPPKATTSNAAANKTLIVALLTTLRDMLVSFLNILKSRSTAGFQGAWQTPSSANTQVFH